MTFALLLFLAAQPAQPRVERSATVPPGRQEVLYIFHVGQRPVRVEARFEADSEVSLVVLEEREFRLRRQGEAHSPVVYSDFERSGAVTGWLRSKGVYLVVADNRMNSQRAATVKLQLRSETTGAARYPNPARAHTLAIASIAVFVILVAFVMHFTIISRPYPRG